VIEGLEQAKAGIAQVISRAVWAWTANEHAEIVEVGSWLVSQLTGVVATSAHELEVQGWAKHQAATSMSTWLRDRVHVSVHTGKQITDLGVQMAGRPAIASAVSSGAVTPDQARVIAAAMKDLPDELDASLIDECETALIGFAATHEPKALRLLGERILAHVAPQIAEEALRAKLERDEARARLTRAFTITSIGEGRARLSGTVDAETAAIIQAAIDPLCAPIPGPGGGKDPRDAGARRADALVEVCRLALATDRLPDNGGQRPQVNVIVDFDALRKELGIGTLDTGESVSPSVVRRLACDAFIIPAVLGGAAEVLDLGRARRLYTGAVRRALELRDGGCAFPHCDRPPKWTDGHHIRSWQDGGETNLDNGVLLCGWHHREVHHSGWKIRLGHDRRPEFIPPAFIDPEQKPLRNLYHQRHQKPAAPAINSTV
jgi:hypothetical protein